MLKLEEIEGKKIRMNYPSYDTAYYYHFPEETKYEYCYFYIDVYYSTSLMFVIVDPGGDSVEHVIDCDADLAILLDKASERTRSIGIQRTASLNYGVESYIRSKIESKNRIVYPSSYYVKDRSGSISKESVKGCLVWMAAYIGFFLVVLLFWLLFKS